MHNNVSGKCKMDTHGPGKPEWSLTKSEDQNESLK